MADLEAVMRAGSHWFRRFRSAAWLIYITEKELVKAGSTPDTDISVPIGSAARELLVGAGISRQRRPLRVKLRSRALKEEAAAIGNRVCVLWVDNYNRLRYSKNPAVARNQSINGTAMAKLPIPPGGDSWTRQPSMKELCKCCETVARDIHQMHRAFINDVRSLELRCLCYEDVRVPCDVRRRRVTSAGWLLHDVVEGNIGSLEGLVKALSYSHSLHV